VSEHEFAFGATACLIRVEGVPAIATMFVVTDNGNELRPIVDGLDENKVIELPMTAEIDALGRAVRYLGKWFGRRGPAPQWARNPLGIRRIGEPYPDERPKTDRRPDGDGAD